MFFKCHVIFSWTLMNTSVAIILSNERFFIWIMNFCGMQKLESNCSFQMPWKRTHRSEGLFIFSTIPSHQNGWALTPCGATHGLWSFWLWGLLRNVGVIDTSVGHGLLRRFKTRFYRTVKSREKLHISTPFVTPKVIINGFPFWIAVWEHVEIQCASHRHHLHSKKQSDPRSIATIHSIPGNSDFWFRRKCQKNTQFWTRWIAFWGVAKMSTPIPLKRCHRKRWCSKLVKNFCWAGICWGWWLVWFEFGLNGCFRK